MDTVEQILKNLKLVHLLFIFCVFFTILFKKQISDLFKRIISFKINKDGISAVSNPEIQNEDSESKTESVQILLDAVGNSIVIEELESSIYHDLKSRGLPIEGDSIKVLVKHLAGTQLLLGFERIHGTIFGSQISLLKKLNEVAGQGRNREYVENYFKSVKNLYAKYADEWTLDQYLKFLFNQSLITVNGEQYHITKLGVEYLIWIARDGKSEDKAL